MSYEGVDRWVYGFRRVGRRKLDSHEIQSLNRLAKRQSALRFQRGAVSALCGAGALLCITIPAGGQTWGWVLVVALGIAFAWTLSWANSGEALSLLYRRAARVGEVDQFVRDEAPIMVREAIDLRKRKHDEGAFGQPYWQAEEKFLEAIQRLSGNEVVRFETPQNDDVLISVEGKWTTRVVDAESCMMRRESLGAEYPQSAATRA